MSRRFKVKTKFLHWRNMEYNYTDYDWKVDKIASLVTHYGYVISIPCLLITFVIYTILPELRNIHGLTLRAYVGCLFMRCIIMHSYVFLVIDVGLPCSCLGLTYFFSFLAEYFWLNVMCFDIWWTLGGFRSLRKSLTAQINRKKFIIYSIYVWGSSTVIVTIWAIRAFAFEIPEAMKTWMNDFDGWCIALYYEYVFTPIGATLFCDMILFLLTVTKIIRHNKMTARCLEGTESRRADNQNQWFGLYVKLFVLMGMTWCFKMIGWLTEDYIYLYYLGYFYEWGIAYQGVIVFIVFICKRNILRSLKKRCSCRGRNNILRSSGKGDYRISTSCTPMTTVPGVEKTKSSPERY